MECPSVTPSCMSAVGSSTRRFQRTCPFSDRFDRLIRSFLFPFFASPARSHPSALSAHIKRIQRSFPAAPQLGLFLPFHFPLSILLPFRVDRARRRQYPRPQLAGSADSQQASANSITEGKSRLRTTSSGFDDSFHRQTRWRSRCADESTDSMQHRRVTKGAACQAGGS